MERSFSRLWAGGNRKCALLQRGSMPTFLCCRRHAWCESSSGCCCFHTASTLATNRSTQQASVGSQRKLPASSPPDAKTLDIPCVVPSSLETRKLRLPSGHHSKHPPPPVVLSESQTSIQQYMCIRLFFARVSCMCVSCFVIVSALCFFVVVVFVSAALFFHMIFRTLKHQIVFLYVEVEGHGSKALIQPREHPASSGPN